MKTDGSAQVVGASLRPGPRLRRGGKPWAFWGKCSCPLHACGRVCTRTLSRTVTHIPAHDTCANARLHTDTHAHSLTHTQLVRSSCILQTCTITDTHTLSHAYILTCTHARARTHTSLTTCPGMPASPSEASSTPCWADEKQRQVRGLQSTSACPRGASPKSPRFYTSGCQGCRQGLACLSDRSSSCPLCIRGNTPWVPGWGRPCVSFRGADAYCFYCVYRCTRTCGHTDRLGNTAGRLFQKRLHVI